MASTVSATVGNVVVVTTVHPVPGSAGHQPSVGTQKCSMGQLLALGTVQIMIGLMVLLCGIVMAINADTLGVYSGIFTWGASFYIIAGSLTVAAGRSMHRCLVNGALAVSVVAAIASFTAIILYSLDTAGVMFYCYGSSSFYDCRLYMSRMQGFSGVLVVFNLLELIVSVTTAGLACNATCNCNCNKNPPVVVVPGNGSVIANPAPDFQAPSSSQILSYPKNPEEQRCSGMTYPPPYNAEEFAHADRPAMNI